MKIELPTCGLKNCKHYFDGNCINKIEYHRCEYQILKSFVYEHEDELLEFLARSEQNDA